MQRGTIRQLLLLTDGCSNTGEQPVEAARFAKQCGLTVNVIGILTDYDQGAGFDEADQIAKEGGGECRVVQPSVLAKTVVQVTRQAMTGTIYSIINKEIQQMLSSESTVESLSPAVRGQLSDKVEEWTEEAALELVVLVDCSASMKPKMPAVEEALYDLSLTMQSRSGPSSFSLWSFPGRHAPAEEQVGWTSRPADLADAFSHLSFGGMTPTGPAIRSALSAFEQVHLHDQQSG